MSEEDPRPLPDDEETDELFRSIVQNYGDRPAVPEGDPEGSPEGGSEGGSGPVAEPDQPVVSPTLFRLAGETLPSAETAEHFVPPPPPPFEWPEPRRGLAWLGLFGGPTLLLLALVLHVSLPSWVTGGLALAFIGGFVFLVATMSQEAGDGWDDGARL